MDIEGHEPWAIKGAMKSLESGLVEVIYLEVSSLHLSRSGFWVCDLFKLLKELGFKLFYVKRSDFESGIANRSKSSTLNVHGSPLTVAEVEDFPDEYQTDILAVHQTTNFDIGSCRS